jgi:hypothetical protein
VWMGLWARLGLLALRGLSALRVSMGRMALTAHRASLVKTVLMALWGLPAPRVTQVTLALLVLRVRKGLLVRTAQVPATRFRFLPQRFWVV